MMGYLLQPTVHFHCPLLTPERNLCVVGVLESRLPISHGDFLVVLNETAQKAANPSSFHCSMAFQIHGRSRSRQFESSKEIKLQAAIITCFRPSACHVPVPCLVPSLNLSDCASKHLDEPCQQGTVHLLLAAVLVAAVLA